MKTDTAYLDRFDARDQLASIHDPIQTSQRHGDLGPGDGRMCDCPPWLFADVIPVAGLLGRAVAAV